MNYYCDCLASVKYDFEAQEVRLADLMWSLMCVQNARSTEKLYLRKRMSSGSNKSLFIKR